MKKLLNAIFWFFYKLTPKGKKEYILRQGFKGIQQNKLEDNFLKAEAIGSANKLLKPKSIIAFNKGKSITKNKKSNTEVISQVKDKHSSQLQERGLKITKQGKFKHA